MYNIPQGSTGRSYRDYQNELEHAEHIAQERQRFEMACWEDSVPVTETGFSAWLKNRKEPDR